MQSQVTNPLGQSPDAGHMQMLYEEARTLLLETRAEDTALHGFIPRQSFHALSACLCMLGRRQAVVISAVWLTDAQLLGDLFASASSASSFLAYISEHIIPTNTLRYQLVPLGRAATQRSCMPKGRDRTASH